MAECGQVVGHIYNPDNREQHMHRNTEHIDIGVKNEEHGSTLRKLMTRVDLVPLPLVYSVSRVVCETIRTSFQFHGSGLSGLVL